MVANMKVDKMDGFCVGEPWNNRAIADGIGFTAITTQQMWKDHPEKVCAFTEEFATKNPKTVKAVLKALHLASVHLDKLENRPKCRRGHRAADLHQLPAGDHPRAAARQVRLRRRPHRAGSELHDLLRAATATTRSRSSRTWWLTQFRRWGMVKGAPDYAGVAKKVMRPDIYLEAMKELGVTPKMRRAARRSRCSTATFDGSGSGEVRAVVPGQQPGG